MINKNCRNCGDKCEKISEINRHGFEKIFCCVCYAQSIHKELFNHDFSSKNFCNICLNRKNTTLVYNAYKYNIRIYTPTNKFTNEQRRLVLKLLRVVSPTHHNDSIIRLDFYTNIHPSKALVDKFRTFGLKISIIKLQET